MTLNEIVQEPSSENMFNIHPCYIELFANTVQLELMRIPSSGS